MQLLFVLTLIIGQEDVNAETLQNMGIIYTERKQYDRAIESFKQAIKLKPSNTELLYHLGIAYYLNKTYQSAIQIFKHAIGLDSLCVDAYFNLGVVFAKLKNYDSAMKYLNKAIELAPEDMESLFYLGNTYLIVGKHESALDVYTRIIGLNPSNPRAYEGRATANWKLGNQQESGEDIRIAKELRSGKPLELVVGVQNFEPTHLEKTPDLGKQIKTIEIALEDTISADPADREILPYIGGIYMTTGDYNFAVIAYSKLIRLSPEEPKGYEGRASAYQRLGLTEKAKHDSEKAKELRKKPRY